MCHKISLHLSNTHKYEDASADRAIARPFLYTLGYHYLPSEKQSYLKAASIYQQVAAARNFSQGFGRKGSNSPKTGPGVAASRLREAAASVRQGDTRASGSLPQTPAFPSPFMHPHTADGASPKERRKTGMQNTSDAGKKGVKKQSTQSERSAEQG